MSVVAAVIPEVNRQLEGASLAGVEVDLGSGEGGFESRGTVGNPHIMRILSVVDRTRLAVVEVVPVAFPCMTHAVGVGRDGGCRHHAVIDFVSVPNVVLGVVDNPVVVLVSHQLKGASEGDRCVNIGQAVADAPVVALAGCTAVAFLWNVIAGILVVPGLAGICHAFVASREFENEFNLVNAAVVAFVPVFKLTVGSRSVPADQTVTKVVVVSVIIRCTKRRCNIEKDAGHTTDVRGGHGGARDGHVIQVSLRSS